MKCGFCSDVATGECAVSITEPRIHMADELEAGDLVQVSWDLQYYLIENIEGEHVTVSVSHKRKLTFHLTPGMPLLKLDTSECATPVCDTHQIDRGDGKAICPHHWEVSVEKVAATLPGEIAKRLVRFEVAPAPVLEPTRATRKKSRA